VPFRDIAGHRRLIALLSRAVARGTMPPSLLMAGPEGVGKKRVALAMAQALNCPTPVSTPEIELDACGECPTCRRVARLVHPAVIVLEPGDSGSIKIEPVRDAVYQAQFRPFEGRRRVVIIDDADALVPPAQNALLKTLEEPPSASVFVLVTSIPDMLLPTVRSRCPTLRFASLSVGDVAEILKRDHDYSEAEAGAVAVDSEGSVKRALQSASSDLADARADAHRLLEQTARMTDPVKRIDSVRDLVGKKGSSAGERDQLAVCLRALSSLLRDLGILSTRADARMLANADMQGELQRLASVWDSARSMRAFTAVDRALAALDRNASPKVVADWLVLQL
jgi:DNA polymerase-3 subunit delta'